jgi:L-lactate dehydrogenase
MSVRKGKTIIVGAGAVGSTLLYNLTLKAVVPEIVLIDLDHERAEAEILDVEQGIPYGPQLHIRAGGYEECRDAELLILAAGAKQKPGESRIDLLTRNVSVTRAVVRSALNHGFEGIFLIITNPVDVLTCVAWKESGFPTARVIGSGTVLDSARLRDYLARHCGVSPLNIHGYVLGEHGDTSFPAWSLVTIGGMKIHDYCTICGKSAGNERSSCNQPAFFEETKSYVREAAYRIIEAKGSTYYAIAQAAAIIVQAIARDEKRILPVSTVHPEYEESGLTAFSVPTILGEAGTEQILDVELSAEEKQSLLHSARFVAERVAEIPEKMEQRKDESQTHGTRGDDHDQ